MKLSDQFYSIRTNILRDILIYGYRSSVVNSEKLIPTHIYKTEVGIKVLTP